MSWSFALSYNTVSCRQFGSNTSPLLPQQWFPLTCIELCEQWIQDKSWKNMPLNVRKRQMLSISPERWSLRISEFETDSEILGAVHKWRHHFWGVTRPPPPPCHHVIFQLTPPFVRINCEKNWSATKLRTPGRWWSFSVQMLFLFLGLIWPLKSISKLGPCPGWL